MQTTFKMRISLHKIVAKKWQNHKDKPLVSSLQKLRKKLNECVFYIKKQTIMQTTRLQKREVERLHSEIKSQNNYTTYSNQ